MRANRRDNALGMFGILDCLEDFRRHIEDCVRFHGGHCRTGPAEHIDDFDLAAPGLLEQCWTFDWKQPLVREGSLPQRFPDVRELSTMFADFHYSLELQSLIKALALRELRLRAVAPGACSPRTAATVLFEKHCTTKGRST